MVMRSDEWLAEQDREVDYWFRIETRKIEDTQKRLDKAVEQYKWESLVAQDYLDEVKAAA
jgi:hypothetical protein